jgi:RND family efflux transporter MFP subunit
VQSEENIMTSKTIIEKIKLLDKKIIASASVFVALTLLGIGAMTFGKEESHAGVVKTEEPVQVSTMAVEQGELEAGVSAAGALSSKNVSVLSSKIMGRVVELTVHEGDYVNKGKLLLRIESGEISAQVYQARAAYNNAKLQYERIKSLFDEHAATRMEMDQATLGFESAKAGLAAARAMESYTIVSAPISGRIVEKRINLGEMALPGQPIVKIEDNRSLRLEATVKEQDIRFVEPGKSVLVRIDALPGREFRARVGQVVPAADPRTHSFVVKIDVPADKGLITGMYGKVFFSTGTRETLLVPRTAVITMSGLSGVYLVSAGGNALFQMIEPGETRGDQIEAVTGLRAGDRVIVSRHAAGIDGRKVIVAQK